MCNHKHDEYLVTTDTLWVICVVCAIPSVYTCIIRIIEIEIWYALSYDIEKCIGQNYFLNAFSISFFNVLSISFAYICVVVIFVCPRID